MQWWITDDLAQDIFALEERPDRPDAGGIHSRKYIAPPSKASLKRQSLCAKITLAIIGNSTLRKEEGGRQVPGQD